MAKYKAVEAAGKLADKQLEPLKKAMANRTEVMADAASATDDITGDIVAVANGIRALRAGRLNDKALLLLIQHATPSNDRPSQGQIKAVLEAIQNLDRTYLK